MFEADKVYRHINARDLDMIVLKILTKTEDEFTLEIGYKYRSTGAYLNFIDTVTIKKKDYPCWEEVSK